MSPRSWPVNRTLLIVQLVLGLLLVVERPRPSDRGQILFWLTVYVVICIVVQVIGVRYWNRRQSGG